MEYSIKTYKTANGKRPFRIWLDDLKNQTARAAIDLRIDRMRMGNFGNCEPLKGSIYELKIDIGPGYRVYFSKIGLQIILLLCAGSKKRQQKDIDKAREYLNDYKKNEAQAD